MAWRYLLSAVAITGLMSVAAPANAGNDDYDRYSYDDDRYEERYDEDRYDRYDDDDRRTYYRREERHYVPRYHHTTIVERRVVPYVQRREVIYDGPCRVERVFLSSGRIEESRHCRAPRFVIQPAPVVEYYY
ncbi:MAG TPA: hypothetical protein VEC57_09730 [Candidatus Limnocylindrales bacterium]|nr:hypothetical protein [Candidatus Limnocylindrales bacterium]